MNFAKNEWYHLGQWVQPVLSACFWNNWNQSENFPPTIPKLEGELLFLDGHHFVRNKDVETLTKTIQSKVNDFSFLYELERWVEEVHERCKEVLDREDVPLLQRLQSVKECMNNIVHPWIFFLTLNDIIENEFKEACKQHGITEVPVIKPSKESFVAKKKRNLELIFNKFIEKIDISMLEQTLPEIAQEVKDHIQQYSFCGVHHFVGQPYIGENLFHEFKIKTENKLQEGVSMQLQWHYKLASIAAFARTYMAETSGYVQHKAKKTLEQVGKVLNIGKEYIWLTIDELIRGLSDPEKFVKPKNIDMRKKRFAIVPTNSESVLHTTDAINIAITQLLGNKKKGFPLSGTVASHGVVRGRAKIVVHPDDINKIEKGDVLVAPETTPDFIAHFSKISGIITNQGGITSHAAIVSREFNIPCIVGVEGATETIEDNDLIEFDTKKGIIIKIT